MEACARKPAAEQIKMQNKLKLIKNLLAKKSAREKEGLFVVEGPHLVEEAGRQLKFFIFSQTSRLVEQLIAQDITGYQVTEEEFDSLSAVENHQGILGVVSLTEVKLDALLNRPDPLLVFCAGVQDPGNLGTIIRSADAFGADGVIISKGTVDPYNPKTVRSTMGSIFHLPLVNVADAPATLEQLKRKNVKIVSTAAASGIILFEANLRVGTAILIGNEGAGLPEELRNLADEQLRIPMPGQAESLNAAAAAAVILAEAVRQREYGREN